MIPVSKPSIGSLEKKYAGEAIDSGWISSVGSYIPKFEDAWAKENGMKFGVACNSGTNALFLAIKGLGIGAGDEVIVPEFTMVATAWAVSYTGATPVFVDCKADLTIDESLIKDKITSRTKAIMPVHIYGRSCNMDAILEIARKHNLFVIEDTAEAHGVKPRGDAACFSFFGNKILTTGEGGMVVTNNERLVTEMNHLRSMYFDPNHTFLHQKIAYNYRMTNVAAAIGLAQVERLDEILTKRKLIESWYDEYLPDRIKMPKRDVLWMYDVNLGSDRDLIKARLKERGVDTRFFFKPMSSQPMYLAPYANLKATHFAAVGLYLPTYTDLDEDTIEFISKQVVNSL